MNIVLVGPGMIPIPPPGYGAVEKHVWNLAQALEARGHAVRIVNELVGPTSKDEYRSALRARKRVQAEPYDVLHVHTPGIAAVFSALGPRRFVFTSHSRHWTQAEGLGPRIGFALEKRAIARAREVIALTPQVAAQMSRPSTVIPNGVDVDRYRPRPEARGGRVAVCLGEMARHKEWHVAAEAAKRAGFELRHVGPIRDTRYADEVEALGDGAVKLLGSLAEEDLAQELGRADAMVHPSVSENLPMAVIEGMASGLPIVASDILGSLVRHGENGYLLPTSAETKTRVAKAAEALARIADDPALARRLGEASRARAEADFSWPRVAERVEQVYRRAVA